MPGRDTKTRFQGVYARHQEACTTTATGDPAKCSCSPSYWGKVWDRNAGKHRKTKRFRHITAAKSARDDLRSALRDGTLPAPAAPRLGEAIDNFIEAAKTGIALNKWGRRYRRNAWEDLESALRHTPSGCGADASATFAAETSSGSPTTLRWRGYPGRGSARSSMRSAPSTAGPRTVNLPATILRLLCGCPR